MARDSGDRSGTEQLVVAYREGRGAQEWQRRHTESALPGRWPYGLDGLADHGFEVRATEVVEPSRPARLVTDLTGPRRHPARGSGADVALCWDEHVAGPMLARVGARRHYSGVIWMTDAVAAGRDDRGIRRHAAALRRMDGLWVLSRPQMEHVRSWLGPQCPPVHFLPFGIDTDYYAERPYPSPPHVVSAGGDRDRDHETLLAALELVAAERPDARFTVQGKNLGAASPRISVVSAMPHRELAELVAAASVVAVATRDNLHASGMTVGLEALATGRPVVVSDTPGMDDYFAPEHGGFRTPVGDPAAMATAILGLLADRDRAAELGRLGRGAVARQHSTGTMCRELAEIVRR